jgi:hypothetical protein
MLHEPGDSLKARAIPERVGMREASIDEFFGVIIVAARGVDDPQLTSWHMPLKKLWNIGHVLEEILALRLEEILALRPRSTARRKHLPCPPALYHPF